MGKLIVFLIYIEIYGYDEHNSRIDRGCPIPVCRKISSAYSCVFDIDKIDRILLYLADTSQQTYRVEHDRSSRLRKGFASKACRISIMIGTDLTKKTNGSCCSTSWLIS